MKEREHPWIDPQMKPILDKMAAAMKELSPPWTRPIENVRSTFVDSMAGWNKESPDLPVVEDKTVPGPFGKVPVRIYYPNKPTDTMPCIVFFHGGGWVVGNPDSHDSIVRFIAQDSGIMAVSVDYGLAPEQHFPDTPGECVAVLRWLKSNGEAWFIDPNNIAVGGDSAGGNLALASALKLRDSGENWLKYCALIYPAISPEKNTDSHRSFGGIEFGNTPDRFDWFWDCYVPEEKDRKNPIAVPLHAEMNRLPPMYLLGAGLDPLVDDLFALAVKLKSAGVLFSLRFVPGVIHGFLHMASKVDAARSSIQDLSAALHRTMT